MSLVLIVPNPSAPPRPEPVTGTLYRCAASSRIYACCGLLCDVAPKGGKCPGCGKPAPTEVTVMCQLFGVIEVRDPVGRFYGSLCQDHALAALRRVPGAKIETRTVDLGDMLEERLGALFATPMEKRCYCTPGVCSDGPNEAGDYLCDTCQKLMLASTMNYCVELLRALREEQKPKSPDQEA